MKGYSEARGLAFKMAFDAVSGQFFSAPVDHPFAPKNEQSAPTKIYHERKHSRPARRELVELLKDMPSEIRDDVGMTEVFAAMR